MPPTVIHLVRHGEVRNDDGVIYGRLPGFHLSSLGRSMAVTVAEHFRGHDIACVASSPLERAQETALEIALAHGLQVETDERLIEAANQFEGIRFGVREVAFRHPQRLLYLANPFRPSWGEPYRSQVIRMQAMVRDISGQADGRAAVLVSHQSPIWALRSTLEGRRPWANPHRRECALASVTTLTYDFGKLLSVAYTEPFRAHASLRD